MKREWIQAAAAAALALGMAGSAQATVKTFNITEYAPGAFGPGVSGSLGTVTVEDFTGSSNAKLENGNQLLITATLIDGFNFMTSTGKSPTDVFAFDLSGNPTLSASSYLFYLPLAGDAGGGNTYAGTGFASDAHGKGFSTVFDYAVQSKDSSAPPTLYGPTLQFRVSAGSALSVASLLGHSVDGAGDGTPATIYAGLDISKGVGLGLTGPAGATLAPVLPPIGGGVPEPASWAMMIAGFGGVGAMIRRRRPVAA